MKKVYDSASAALDGLLHDGMLIAAGAHPFGQRALRVELDLELARQVLLHEQVVLADIGRDHLADLAGFQQLAQAKAIHTCVVGNHGEVLDAGIAQGVDQRFRNATQTETTHSHELAVCNHALEGLSCGGE